MPTDDRAGTEGIRARKRRDPVRTIDSGWAPYHERNCCARGRHATRREGERAMRSCDTASQGAASPSRQSGLGSASPLRRGTWGRAPQPQLTKMKMTRFIGNPFIFHAIGALQSVNLDDRSACRPGSRGPLLYVTVSTLLSIRRWGAWVQRFISPFSHTKLL